MTTTRAFSRRGTLSGAAAAAAAAVLSGHVPPVAAAETADGLAAIARSSGLLFGSACGGEVLTDTAYRDLFVAQAAILAPESALKFDVLQPQQGVFNFAPGDALVDGARSRGLLARGHTLFWNDWPPRWLKSLGRRDVERVFDTYLDTVVPHFAGRLHSWDVVNEPFWLGKDKPGTFRSGPWYDTMGPDYIYRAFRRAAELDPHAKLVLNEAWTERNDPVGLAVRRSLLTLVDRMRDKGLKLDAVGLQGHLLPTEPHDDAGFADFLHQLAERKVEIFITEFDVDDEGFPEADAARDRAVAQRAGAFLRAALAVPAVTTVITWGLSDRYTWWRNPDTMAAHGLDRLARPLPYDDMLQRKPMWTAMAEAFRARPALIGP